MPAVLAEPESILIELPEEVKPGGPGGGGPRNFEPGGDGGGGGDDDRERNHGPSMGMVGMLATMFSITALFATIAIAFVVRSKTSAHWQAVSLPPLLWVSTVAIVFSSVTLEIARRSFKQLRSESYLRWLNLTFCLGLAFMVLQALSLRQMVMQGVYLRQNPHSWLFFIITGAHGVHLFGGMLALLYMIYRAAQATDDVRADLSRQQVLVSVSTVYWHYLDALWLALFAMLLLLK